MRNVLVIFKKELKSYFASPIALSAVDDLRRHLRVLFLQRNAILHLAGNADADDGPGHAHGRQRDVIRPLLTNASVIGLFLIPMITMRLYAEEKRSGTIELLMTSPVRDLEIVLGKWLAALVLYAAILGISGINLGILYAFGRPDWKPILVGYLGLLLQGGCLLAIGIFISTTTKNQIIAGGATFAVCLMLWVLDWVSAYDQSAWAKVISYLSVVTHFEPFSKGVIDSKDVIFYLSMIFFGLFLTARSVESLRWRA